MAIGNIGNKRVAQANGHAGMAPGLLFQNVIAFGENSYISPVGGTVRRIDYSLDAVRSLSRTDRATARRIRAKLKLLAENPSALANNVTALKGGDGLMRLRVGDWRVIYSQTHVALTIVRIAPRGSAYD